MIGHIFNTEGKRRAFTLMEMLVAAGLTSVVAGAVKIPAATITSNSVNARSLLRRNFETLRFSRTQAAAEPAA